MKKSIIISLIFILIPITVFARYYEKTEKIIGKGTIAEPIIIVENISNTKKVEVNKNTKEEYIFKVKNYYIDKNENKKISEVGFYYTINVINKDSNFPIAYKLLDEENKEIDLSKLVIKKDELYEKTFKLVIYWEDKEKASEQDEIEVEVKASQMLT